MNIVHQLPEHVELSEHLREQAAFYICVESLGVGYYIPGTPEVCQLLELDSRGRDAKRDQRRRWNNFRKADALRDIVSALSLQVRDVELAGVERNVSATLLSQMRKAMRPTLRRTLEDHPKVMLMLENKNARPKET